MQTGRLHASWLTGGDGYQPPLRPSAHHACCNQQPARHAAAQRREPRGGSVARPHLVRLPLCHVAVCRRARGRLCGRLCVVPRLEARSAAREALGSGQAALLLLLLTLLVGVVLCGAPAARVVACQHWVWRVLCTPLKRANAAMSSLRMPRVLPP